MNTFKLQPLLLVIVFALLGGGCAARLATKVHVYHPELRMIELQEKRGSSSSPTRLETRLREQLDHHRKQKPIDPWEWYQERVADLRAYNQLATNVINVLAPFLPRGAVSEQFKTDYLGAANAVVQGALTGVGAAWMKFLTGEASFPETHNRIIGRFYQFSPEFAVVLNPVERGDPNALPPAALNALTTAKFELAPEIGGGKQKTLGAIVGTVAELKRELLGGVAGQRVEQKSDKGGVVRPDSVIETYTDPLLTAALDDPLGWTPVPAAASTEADGKSSVVIVRDGQFSFSVHSFDNDPTEVIAARARMASSTAKIIAESVAMFSGAPGLPKVGGSRSGTNESGATATVPPIGLPASAYLAIARERERRVATLLKDKPADAANAAAVQKWINEVNALFEPLILNQP